jgi:hypothetical protein
VADRGNVLSSVYSYVKIGEIDRCKYINQKFFYCEINVNGENQKVTLIKTKEKIKLKKKDKKILEEYLLEHKIDIEYFKNFEGYINIIRIESFNKKYNIYKKYVCVYFYNLMLKIKDGRILIIRLQLAKDADIIIILLKNFFYDCGINIIKSGYFNFSYFKKEISKFFMNPLLGYNCEELLDYILKYKEYLLD